ncbi:MAG: hypothetical protein LDL39_18120 [Magnetospirillum sp.]|nr:hypothetical protein [Magnetospirillum sp.]
MASRIPRNLAWASAFVVACLGAAWAGAASVPSPKRVTLTGEVIDSWCQTTGIMVALGTAHHQCAIWCAVGGIPVGLRTDDGTLYTILRVDQDKRNVANPRLLTIQTHQISVTADLIERDGNRYLLIDQVLDDHGIVNRTHGDYGIQPFGE